MSYFSLVMANLRGRPVGTILTGVSVAVAVFIFASLLSLDLGLERMISSTGHESVITVFERYKACPPYSSLTAHYETDIAEVEGVSAVMGVRFLMSNCQTTTDLVSVHGVDPEQFRHFESIDIDEADYQRFVDGRDAALVGRRIAERYQWEPGDQVVLEELGGVPFVIEAIFDAPGSALESVIVVDREYLEYTIDQVGVVTMFRVLVEDDAAIDEVSEDIDDTFANHNTSTRSGPERAFITDVIDDFSSLLHLSRLVAYLSLILVFVIVANSISISVRDRLREWALMRVLGYRRTRIVALVAAEGLIVATVASVVGCATAWTVINTTDVSISVEGYTIVPHLSVSLMGVAVGAGALLGVLGSLPAAFRCTRGELVDNLGGIDE